MLERRCLALKEEVEHESERQEVFDCSDGEQDEHAEDGTERYRETIFEELKKLEEQRTKEALELVQKKHKLIKWEGERERARTLQRLEA